VKLLALDTTEDACSAALLIDDGIIERFEVAPRRHSELVLPMMDELLREADLAPGALDAIGFAAGPGSFTGVRIATAIAQGAAFGVGLPLVPVSSLQALAQGAARRLGAERVLAALDARMHEVYWGGYVAAGKGLVQPVIDDCVVGPDQVPVPLEGDWVGAGSGWASYQEALGRRCPMVCEVDAEARIRAQDVARLAAAKYAAGESVSPEQARPVYLRDQVAWAKP
jgi:tRNA threonylcarbamoyladenosine biosynthesis protein TsaB